MGEEGKKKNRKKGRRRNICRERQRKKGGDYSRCSGLGGCRKLTNTDTGSPGNEMIVKEGNRKPLVT